MGMLSAFGPFVTDFYLPAFPSVAAYFGSSASLVQLSLTTGMLGLGGGQLIIGPLSDKYGRKRLIIGSLLLFVLSTVACIFAPTISLFIIFRLFQGIAGAGGVVASKSVAADLFSGHELTRFFSLLMMVNGLAPIAAPVFGGLLIKVTTWRGIFVALLLLGMVLLLLNARLKESLAADRRIRGSLFSTFRNFIPILRNRHFIYYVMSQTMAMGFLFSYISASPFLFQNHFHLDPIMYSVLFGINSLGIMAGSRMLMLLREKKALLVGGIGLLATGFSSAAILVLSNSLLCLEVSLFLQMMCLGLILPASTSLGLDLERSHNGSASAIMGFLPFLAGSIVSPLVGLGNLIHSTAIAIVICCLLSLFFIILAVKRTVGTEA